MAGLAAGAISLPRQLWLTRLVLQCCGAGFGFYDHGTPAAGDGDSVPELGSEASKTKKLGVVPESNRLSKCVVRLSLPMDYRPQAF
jgi:hypothetical protein